MPYCCLAGVCDCAGLLYLYRKNGRGVVSFPGDESGVLEKLSRALCSSSMRLVSKCTNLALFVLLGRSYWFGCLIYYYIESDWEV